MPWRDWDIGINCNLSHIHNKRILVLLSLTRPIVCIIIPESKIRPVVSNQIKT